SVVVLAGIALLGATSHRSLPSDVIDWPRSHRAHVDALLLFERSMALPSGVAFLFPLLFLNGVLAAWVVGRLYGRYVLEQLTPASKVPPLEDESDVDAATWNAAFKGRDEYLKTAQSNVGWIGQLPWMFGTASPLALVCLGIFLHPIVAEGREFDA